ncbi:MAG: four helix bundle protein [Anaerolineae bacterium]|nr:four helix bundle protein [Anaerolineae bacterium]
MVTYAEWEQYVPDAMQREPQWNFVGYRKALFLYDLCWLDCDQLNRHPSGKAVAQQLIRSSGSISANIEEGQGRGFSKDRDYFLRVALGSARESKGWYYRAQAVLKSDVLQHRWSLIDEVIALLVTELNKKRRYSS